MSDTTNLDIPFITTGQNQKETTANTAFEALDNSVNAAVSVAMADANVTLTDTQALRAGMVALTGANTAIRKATLPTKSRRIAVRNATTGGFAVTVGYATGAEVTILSGTTAIIQGDGSNCYATGAQGIVVEDSGSAVATATRINFTGAGVVATDSGGAEVEVAIAGGGSGVDVEDEGTPVMTAAVMNFIGSGISVVDAGGGVANVTVTTTGAWDTIRKTADQSKTSDTTLAADTHLVAALAASTTYTFRLTVWLSTDATPDAKYDLNYTGSVTSVFLYVANTGYSGAISSADLNSQTRTSLLPSYSLVGSTGTLTIFLEGVITTDTSGTLEFRWAQNTSSATATTVRKGSYLEVMQIP
jgi:hypothetical protein